MVQEPITIPSGSLIELFPFHLAINRKLVVVQIGSSLQRILPELVGTKVSDSFRLSTGACVDFTWNALTAIVGEAVQLKHNLRFLTLGGQFSESNSHDILLFICYPELAQSADFTTLGLSIHDYPAYAPVKRYVAALNDVDAAADTTARFQNELASVRKKYIEELERDHAAIEGVKDVVFQTDAVGHWTYLNPAWHEITGFTVEESLGRLFLDFVHPEDHKRNIAEFEPLITRKKSYCRHEVRYLTSDGGFIWIEVFARLTFDDGCKPSGTVGTLRDMTKRRWHEEELKRLTAIIESTDDFVSRASFDGKLLYANAALRRFMNISADQVTTKTIFDYVEPRFYDKRFYAEQMQHFIEAGRWQGETCYLAADGTAVPVSLNVIAHYDENGKPEYMSGIARDISSLRKTEEELRLAQSRLEEAQSVAHIGSGEYDVRTRAISWSPELFRLMELDESQSPPDIEATYHLFIEEDAARLELYSRRAYYEHVGYDLDLRRIDSHGVVRNYRAIGKPILDKDGVLLRIIHTCMDITEYHELSQQLQHVQRLDSIGRFAGAIAHDFNNLLAIIMGHSEIISTTHDPELADSANSILCAAERAAALTKQLLAFAHKQSVQPDALNPQEVINRLITMLRPITGPGIAIETHFPSDSRAVWMDPAQLEQVLVNLVVNARDAIGAQGKIVISTENVCITSDDFREGLRPGDYVLISVADNGAGIPAAIRDKIFEPFFTTKPRGKGTGLGLATVYGIVTHSQGTIRCVSEPGKGTTMKVFLPASESQETVPNTIETASETPMVAARILVVDDEPMVRQLLTSNLKREGYTILEAANGVAALELIESLDEPVDLVITDAIMPQIDGPELAKKILERWPSTAILMVSGYTGDSIPGNRGGVADLPLIQKPFKRADLLEKVKTLLRQTDAR